MPVRNIAVEEAGRVGQSVGVTLDLVEPSQVVRHLDAGIAFVRRHRIGPPR